MASATIMAGKVVMVTGGSGGIGSHICQRLAEKGAEVVLVCRNKTKPTGTEVVQNIVGHVSNENVRVEVVDLSVYANVKAFADRYTASGRPLHVLINGAAVAPLTKEFTADGIERTWATNVMSYFWMCTLFRPVLARSAPARVINVASYWAGGLDFTDLQFVRRMYSNDDAYRQSKQADRMLTMTLSERFKEEGITVNACHTGDVKTQLSDDLGFGGHESGDAAAETPVWLATSPAVARTSGEYFEHCNKRPCEFRKHEAVEQLYSVCESMTPES